MGVGVGVAVVVAIVVNAELDRGGWNAGDRDGTGRGSRRQRGENQTDLRPQVFVGGGVHVDKISKY